MSRFTDNDSNKSFANRAGNQSSSGSGGFAEKHQKSHTAKFKNSKGELVYLMHGMDQGKAAWYYVHFKNNIKYMALKKRLETDRGQVNLLDYGEIVECGWGDMPPEDVRKKVEEMYS